MTQPREDVRPPLVRPAVRKLCFVLLAGNVVVYALPWVVR